MSFTIIASVSLLALVSTARPIPVVDDEWNALQFSVAEPPVEIQYTIQSVVKSRSTAPEELEEHDIPVQLASVQEIQAYLQNVDDASVKALVHLDPQELHSADEKEMYDTLQRLELERGRRTPVPDDILDRLPSRISSPSKPTVPLATIDERDQQEDPETQEWYSVFLGNAVSTPVLVMVVSCVVSLLTLGCIATVIYTAELLKKSFFRSDAAWSILPQLEKSGLGRENQTSGLAFRGKGTTITFSEKSGRLLTAPSVVRTSNPEKTDEEKGDEEDVLDEKFFDAEGALSAASSPYGTPLAQTIELPPAPSLPAQAHVATRSFGDPIDLPSLPGSLPPTIPSRPPWSVRASEVKLPALLQDSHPHAHSRPRERRAYGANAELDAALAMQLRPGLGLGADGAWLVRFVMAVFGWCAVLITSSVPGPVSSAGGRGRQAART